MRATVNAKTVRAVLGIAQASGLDAAALAAAYGLTAALTDVDARFPHASWMKVWSDLIARSGGEAIGITAAERLPWGHWDVMDYLIATTDDLAAALRRFERFFAIISTAVSHSIEPLGDGVRIVRRYAPECQTRVLAPAEFAYASLMVRTRLALGVRWAPVRVAFASPPPASDAAYRKFFGCPVEFDAALSTIDIGAAALALKMPRPDTELRKILEAHAEILVGGLGGDADLVSRVKRIIVDGLTDADVTLAHAAKKLAMSARTLQRRLADAGVTFDALYDRTRHELATRYLGEPALSIQETAHLLAFGDLRGFYRAFRRWEGCTPAEFRRVGAPRP